MAVRMSIYKASFTGQLDKELHFPKVWRSKTSDRIPTCSSWETAGAASGVATGGNIVQDGAFEIEPWVQ